MRISEASVVNGVRLRGPCTVRALTDALLGRGCHPRPVHLKCRALLKKGVLIRDGSAGIFLYSIPPAKSPVSSAANVQKGARSGRLHESSINGEDDLQTQPDSLGGKRVKVVIQCAKGKDPAAPSIFLNACPLCFVAIPSLGGCNCRAPWDHITPALSRTFIDCVRDYNGQKPPGLACADVTLGIGAGALTPAADIYKRTIYRDLVATIGWDNVYILSAGWGLIRADDKIPPYNVTFSSDKWTPPSARITPAKRTCDSIRQKVPGNDEIHLFLTPKYLKYWIKCFHGQFGSRRVILHWRKCQKLPNISWPPNDIYWHSCGNPRQWPYDAAKEWLTTEG
jgi:hypothetical protein